MAVRIEVAKKLMTQKELAQKAGIAGKNHDTVYEPEDQAVPEKHWQVGQGAGYRCRKNHQVKEAQIERDH